MAVVLLRNNFRYCKTLVAHFVPLASITSSQHSYHSVILGNKCLDTVGSSIIGQALYIDYIPNLQIATRPRTRNKSTKNRSEKARDSDSDSDDELHDNEWSDKDSRVVKLKVNSLRTDLIIKAGLGIARNKVEGLFYDSKLRVNGQKIFKKSVQIHAGDEIDVIRGTSPMNPDHILVSRIEILSAKDNVDGTVSVQLRRTKTLTIDNYDDPWKAVKQD